MAIPENRRRRMELTGLTWALRVVGHLQTAGTPHAHPLPFLPRRELRLPSPMGRGGSQNPPGHLDACTRECAVCCEAIAVPGVC